MNISIKRIFLLSIWLITGVNSYSQYYVKFKGDSIGFENDSVVLALDNIITNNLNWEISKDSVTWESLNKINDTLVIRIHDNSFYRAVLSEGTCYPIKSDVAFAGFKSKEVSDNSVVIDSTGGVYVLSSGIKLFVPPNAVNENVTVIVDFLDSINAELQMPFDADIGKVFCSAIHCEPIQFLKPIKISIPAPNIQHNDLPYVYLYDDGSGFWMKFTDELIFSEKMQLIEFSSDKLVSTRIQLFKDIFEFNNKLKDANPEDPVEDKCMEGFIKVRSDAYDYSGQKGSSECYVSSDKTTVIFLECPGKPIHEAKIAEIGKDCEPKATDNLEDIACLQKGKSATINVNVTIGGMPLEKQDIQFYNLPDGLSVKKSQDFTDKNGNAKFTFTCNDDDFSGTVYYKVYYNYFLEIIEASNGSVSQKVNNYERIGIIEKKLFINECPLKSIKILANRELSVGKTTPIECECRDKNGEVIDCGDVEYILRDVYTFPASNIISVSSEGMVTALKPGLALVQARSGDVISDYERGYFSVAYKGDLKDLNITFDNNIYKKCACEQDLVSPPYDYNWWVVSFTGSYSMTLYLHEDDIPSAKLEGEGTITYSITGSTQCKGASFNEPVNVYAIDNSFYFWPPDSGTPTADNIIEGKEFHILFGWVTGIASDWRYRYLGGKAKMINPHEIVFTIMEFQPDVCIQKDVVGSCILK